MQWPVVGETREIISLLSNMSAAALTPIHPQTPFSEESTVPSSIGARRYVPAPNLHQCVLGVCPDLLYNLFQM